MQRRFLARGLAGLAVQNRADAGRGLSGYAAVFYDAANPGTEYELWENYRERIMPGAFDRALREGHDVRALFNHDASALLGRTAAGTLRLSVDAVGLRYDIDLPDTAHGRDVPALVGRGDLSGSSFAFVAKRTVWIEEGELLVRQVEDLDLYDVGPVTYPAYDGTSAALRASGRDELDRERAEWLDRRARRGNGVAIRARLVEIEAD